MLINNQPFAFSQAHDNDILLALSVLYLCCDKSGLNGIVQPDIMANINNFNLLP